MKRIQVCSKKWPHPFPNGDNNERAKINGRNSKLFQLPAVWADFKQTWPKASMCDGIQVNKNKNYS